MVRAGGQVGAQCGDLAGVLFVGALQVGVATMVEEGHVENRIQVLVNTEFIVIL